MSESGQDSKPRKSPIGSEDIEAEAKLNNRVNFLLAELGHFGQSLLQNEQMGEGRFRFLLTLITASIAGLVALHTTKNEALQPMLPYIVNIALIVLSFFGVLTYLRMLQRDRVSEGYKQDLMYIRHLLRDEVGLTPHYEVPFRPHTSSAKGVTDNAKKKWHLSKRGWEGTLRAGYTQTVGAVCVLLLSMLVFYDLYIIWDQGWLITTNAVQVILGVPIFFVVLCLVASDFAVKSRDRAKKHAKCNRMKTESAGEKADEAL
jgi:hypothetical protein